MRLGVRACPNIEQLMGVAPDCTNANFYRASDGAVLDLVLDTVVGSQTLLERMGGGIEFLRLLFESNHVTTVEIDEPTVAFLGLLGIVMVQIHMSGFFLSRRVRAVAIRFSQQARSVRWLCWSRHL